MPPTLVGAFRASASKRAIAVAELHEVARINSAAWPAPINTHATRRRSQIERSSAQAP